MSDVQSKLADNEVMVASLRTDLESLRRENGTSVCLCMVCSLAILYSFSNELATTVTYNAILYVLQSQVENKR